MDKRYFSDKIVKWYLENKRNLPWRTTRDPYKIWLSEIILQQTRVSQGLPYYLEFTQKYPTVSHLANASEQDVLRTWQGLGYYTRARNLHRCAKLIANEYKGIFPSSFAELRELPGVGDYTAAAVASFSFKEASAVVDGNVFRLLARVFGIETAINSSEGKKIFGALAARLLDERQPDIYNQAIMEFGAICCTPKAPKCFECPLQKNCVAHERSLKDILPVKLKAKASRKRFFYYLVFEDRRRLAMKQRVDNDIWKGLYDFRLIERKKATRVTALLNDPEVSDLVAHSESVHVTKPYKHVLTHQTIFARFVIIRKKGVPKKPLKGLKNYSLTQIGKLPKPVLVSRFLSDHYVS